MIGGEQLWRELHTLLEMGGAALLGGAIGFERELRQRPAGLRTHMLVAAASALIVSLSESLRATAHPSEAVDPVRTVQAVVMGVTFLGAGTIFRDGTPQRVSGLTTAATLLVAAGLGIAVALRQWVLACGTTLLALLILHVFGRLEEWLGGRYGAPPAAAAPVEGDEPKKAEVHGE